MDHSFIEWEWLVLWRNLNPPVFLKVSDYQPEAERVEEGERKSEPEACGLAEECELSERKFKLGGREGVGGWAGGHEWWRSGG